MLEGMLLVTPAPSFAHQIVATRLATMLANALSSGAQLAVEVLSPSSRLYDREVKRGAYLALGVEEYWIVDPDDCSVETWSRERSQGLRVTEQLVWRPAPLDREIVIDFRELCRDVS